jgi:D-glycerate 3-kinase
VKTGASRQTGYDAAFVEALLDDALAQGRRVLAIAGLQGTGKSTLAAQLVAAARARGLGAEALSIDDFYLTRRERLVLARRVHPLLATRGPPGTHDVGLACATVDALLAMGTGCAQGAPHGGTGADCEERRGTKGAAANGCASGAPPPVEAVRVPVFDKIADRRLPPSRWRPVRRPPDLLVFEGWFLKVPPQAEAALEPPLNALESGEDPEGAWRHYVNAALAGYAPLWARMPWLLFLRGPGFEVVRDWRWQQERTLQAAHPGRRAMSREQVLRFVLFFERVSRQALATLPAIADRVIELDSGRRFLRSDG